jgi:hypothetical protein
MRLSVDVLRWVDLDISPPKAIADDKGSFERVALEAF